MINVKEVELAKKLVNYSCRVQKGEKVWIEYSDCNLSFVNAVVEQVFLAGGYPFVKNKNFDIIRAMLTNGDETYFKYLAEYDANVMKDMDAVILIKGEDNVYELSDIDKVKMASYDRIYNGLVHLKHRLSKKWVLLRFPTKAFAQSSKMSTAKFTEYFYKVCTLDYSKMCKCMDALVELMNKTDKVRIITPNTDLEFSIKGVGVVKCCGECNIPDGECYTAPVKNSVNGVIKFNIPAMYNGVLHSDIVLHFKDGKIIQATSSDTERLNAILDTDDGARYLGEFSFGLNPYIDFAINDILFDEKMCQSIHLACGNSYADASNGNSSSVHWDLIQSHDERFGGGEIYFDGKLIRKNGEFIPNELVALNKNNLI